MIEPPPVAAAPNAARREVLEVPNARVRVKTGAASSAFVVRQMPPSLVIEALARPNTAARSAAPDGSAGSKTMSSIEPSPPFAGWTVSFVNVGVADWAFVERYRPRLGRTAACAPLMPPAPLAVETKMVL